MHPRRFLGRSLAVTGLAALVAGLITVPSPAGASPAADEQNRAAAGRAVDWVATQQQADGGFEVAKFAGFETPEAVLAVATEAQSSVVWSARQGLLAVQSRATSTGRTGLDYLDDYAEATGDDAIAGGAAAKLITLVAGPLCLDAAAFDPQRDGGVDLVSRMLSAARDNGAFGPDGVFSDTLYAVLAHATLGRDVPAKTVTFIEGAQQDDGGWNYSGSPESQGFDDIDTTAVAVQALIAAGVDQDNQTLADGIAFLVERQAGDGSWGFGDPNSTAVAAVALRAAGVTPTASPEAFLRSKQGPDGRVASPNDSFGVNTYATTQAVRGLLGRSLPIRIDATSCPAQGYALFAADGGVFTFGATSFYGSVGDLQLNSPVVSGAVTTTGRGYLLFAADGGVFSFGDAVFAGSMGSTALNQPIVAGASTPSGKGYLLFAADGGVFAFGDAPFLGSAGGSPLNQPIVGGWVTPSGRGYALVARDGGVFTFGDAVFAGSLGAAPLNEPVVAGVVTPTGRGYLLVSSDGGVFTFGDARFAGSLGSVALNSDVVAVSVTPTSRGYLLFSGDGGAFAFGDGRYAGAAGMPLNSPVVGAALD